MFLILSSQHGRSVVHGHNPLQKTPQSAPARVYVKIIPNTMCLQAFQHKNLKNQMLFTTILQISCPGALAEIIAKPWESQEFGQIQRCHVTARCTRDGRPVVHGDNPLQRTPQRAHARVHVRILPNTMCLQAFQHKNLKNPMLFTKKMQISCPGALAEIIGKP